MTVIAILCVATFLIGSFYLYYIFLLLLDLMRRQEELRRLEELRNQELQKRKQIQLRYFVSYCAKVWHAAAVGAHEFRYSTACRACF